MNSKLYFTITAVVALAYGSVFVLIPAQVMGLYGITGQPDANLNIQFFGASLISLGVISWFGRTFRDWAAMRGVLIGGIAGDTVGLLVTLGGLRHGLLNSLGWSTAVVYGLLLIGACYCLATGKRKSERAQAAHGLT